MHVGGSLIIPKIGAAMDDHRRTLRAIVREEAEVDPIGWTGIGVT